jgi:hypothetical protein
MTQLLCPFYRSKPNSQLFELLLFPPYRGNNNNNNPISTQGTPYTSETHHMNDQKPAHLPGSRPFMAFGSGGSVDGPVIPASAQPVSMAAAADAMAVPPMPTK